MDYWRAEHAQRGAHRYRETILRIKAMPWTACRRLGYNEGNSFYSLVLFLRTFCSVDWNDSIEACTSMKFDRCFTSDSWYCGVVLHLKIGRERELSSLLPLMKLRFDEGDIPWLERYQRGKTKHSTFELNLNERIYYPIYHLGNNLKFKLNPIFLSIN